MSNITEWMNILGNVGFPIAITVYLLFRFDRRIEALETVIQDLSEAINKLRG